MTTEYEGVYYSGTIAALFSVILRETAPYMSAVSFLGDFF